MVAFRPGFPFSISELAVNVYLTATEFNWQSGFRLSPLQTAEPETALEQSWSLVELYERFGLSLEELAPRSDCGLLSPDLAA